MHLRTGMGVETGAAGDMDHVHIVLEDQGLLRAVVGGDAAFLLVVAVEAHFDDHVVADGVADGLDDFQRIAAAVFHGAAVFIGTLVAQRRQEVVHQPAVAVMQQNTVEAGTHGEHGGIHIHFLDIVHVLLVHGLRHAAVVHEGAGADELISRPGKHAAAGMVDFAQRLGAVHVRGALQIVHVNEAVHFVIQHQVAAMAAVGGDFHGNGDAGRAAAGPVHVEFHTVAVQTMMRVHDVALRTDGRNHDAVFKGHLSLLADGERSKDMGILFLVQWFHRLPPDVWPSGRNRRFPCAMGTRMTGFHKY